jgi:hypothetical protein
MHHQLYQGLCGPVSNLGLAYELFAKLLNLVVHMKTWKCGQLRRQQWLHRFVAQLWQLLNDEDFPQIPRLPLYVSHSLWTWLVPDLEHLDLLPSVAAAFGARRCRSASIERTDVHVND